MSDPRHIIIAGAGIVGVSTAIHLQRAGCRVTLIDKAGPGEGTSHGNGGVLASCSVVPITGPGLIRKAPGMLLNPDQPLFMRWGYLPRLMPWLMRYLRHANAADSARIAKALAPIVGDSLAEHQSLAKGTGAEGWIVPDDYVFVYRDRAHFDQDAFAWGLRRDNGFCWEELEGQAFANYDPVFADRYRFGVRLAGHGRITDPGCYVKALAAHIEAGGGRILRTEVSGIAQQDGRLTGVRAGGQTIACDAAVIATGVWSAPLAKALGVSVPLESERGYHIELWKPSFMPRAPVMIAAHKFVATPMAGRLRLAGVVEFGGLDAPASEAPLALLKRNAKATFPGLAWDRMTEWLGHRPAPTDSIPIIGAAPRLRGAFMGFGHHHVGLTGGPATGRLLAAMLTGRHVNIDLTPYSPLRFARHGG